MRVEINDLRKVVLAASGAGRARGHGGPLAGGLDHDRLRHLGLRRKARGSRAWPGSCTTTAGATRTPITEAEAEQGLAGPGGGLPLAGLRRDPGPVRRPVRRGRGDAAIIDPNEPSLGQSFPLLPANLKPPVPATNLAQWGYAADTETSPSNLSAFQAHVGRLAASGDPRGWDQAGEITPIVALREDVLGLVAG